MLIARLRETSRHHPLFQRRIDVRHRFSIQIALLAATTAAYGQVPVADRAPAPHSIRFEHLTERDGLSQGCAYAIYQDSRGFLWAGTQDGLNRYDGYGFRVYYPGTGGSDALISGWVTAISEGRDGSLWLGADDVVSRFDPASDTFVHYRHDPRDSSSVVSGPMEAVFEDRLGGLWVGSQAGLSYRAPGSDEFVRFKFEPSDPTTLSHNAVFDIHEDASGLIWIATGNGLSRVDPRRPNQFERFLRTDLRPGERLDAWSLVFAIAQTPDEPDVLWLGT
ncbi:MAG TPA: two-component regulator propeller domain-containing protein, partial [Rhodothermales bacterium]